ncbi:MAG: hypothetical protein RL417_361 [Pseudomonadota bacterium]
MSRLVKFLSLALCVLPFAGCSDGSGGDAPRVVRVYGAFATQIEEPWNGVVHGALLEAQDAGEIEYTFTAGIGYDNGAMEGELRGAIATFAPEVIIGDAFGNESAARRVAADHPEVAFAMGSAQVETAPNFAVFDNWIHEPAYLSGILAGGLTESNVIGIVGGYPVAEVNRLVNAFIAGARSVNPAVVPLVTYLSSWYDPAGAAFATEQQIAAGADVFFAERAGVIEAADAAGFLSFGNILDQRSVAPQSVVTSNLWEMTPTVAAVLDEVRAEVFTAQNLREYSMVMAGGAALAPVNTGVRGGVPANLIDRVNITLGLIRGSKFVVPVDESTPAGAVIR